jgi:hypothetical protein
MAFSFINWIVSLFSGKNDPETTKQQLLKRMVKILAGNQYRKFFRIKTEEMEPDLARFFFDIYRILSPAQTLMQNAAQSTQLKIAVIHEFLEKRQQDTLEGLTSESIQARLEETSSQDLSVMMQKEFDDFTESFTADQINLINGCYNSILIFVQFVNFDFYYILKKFDSQLKENNFSRKPIFSPIRGQIVSDAIKDFLEFTGGIDSNRDWDTVFRILKDVKGMDVVNPKLWNAMLVHLQDVKHSMILEMIVRFVDKDPDWNWTYSIPKEDIVHAYLGSIRGEIFEFLHQLTTSKVKAKIIECATVVFGDPNINRLKYYTENAGEVYLKKNFAGFPMAGGLNYLQAFLLNEKDEFQYLYDLIFIRGQWVSSALSLPLSESVRLLLTFPDRITALDTSLADGGLYGNRLKSALAKVDREKTQARFIKSNLDTVNNDAKQILTDAIFNLSVLQDGFKDIQDDYQKRPSLIILNWVELEPLSEEPMEARLARINGKLYNILQLLRIYAMAAEGIM